MKQTETEKAVTLLKKKLSGHHGSFTLTDAASATGLSIDEAREGLDEMMTRYACRLQLTENGDLIYSFGRSLKRRGAKSAGEILAGLAELAWRGFKVFFKAWITVMLVVYFVVFVVLLIAMTIAISRGGDSRKSIKLDWVGHAFFAIFQWRTYNNYVSYSTDRHGYRFKQYQNKGALFPAAKDKNKKNFIAAVYDFVFGPPRVTLDPLANEKEVAAFLRKHKGILTISELVALAGWTFDQAEEVMSDYLVRFRGEPVISDDGVLYGKFDEILRSGSTLSGGKIEYFWDEYEPPHLVTGNTTGRNALIIFMNGLNLLMSMVVLFSPEIQQITAIYGLSEFWMRFFLGWFPAIFSLTFFLVPILRVPTVLAKEKDRQRANKRKRLIKVVFRSPDTVISPTEVMKNLRTSSERPLSEDEVRQELDRLVSELQGEKQLADQTGVSYRFSRISDESRAANQLRLNRKVDTNLGDLLVDN